MMATLIRVHEPRSGEGFGAGTICIGHLLASARGWRAFNADDCEIGVFASQQEAVEALAGGGTVITAGSKLAPMHCDPNT